MLEIRDIVVVGVPLIAIFSGILFNKSDVKELRSELKELRGEMKAEFNTMDDRFNRIDDHMGRIDADLRQFYHLTGKLEARMDAIEKRS